MRGRLANQERAIALVLAVAIMAVLAVVGFSFASSARMERAATSAVSDVARARLAAYAALQTFPSVLFKDAMYKPGLSVGGPMADHPGETGLFGASMGSEGQLQTIGHKTVLAEISALSDESGKMNLNCFGNISKWDRSAPKTDSDARTISDPGRSLYHGANHRFSSFEVSFEEFFYCQRGTLWPWVPSNVCRIRSARLAMAICLYRFGGDRFPGGAGDDDGDNALLTTDGLDNDGDGLIDEPNEGVNEPDEYNPFDPDGDGDVNTANGGFDDRRFESIGDFKTAIATVDLAGTGVAVSYAADPVAEADRIFQLVRSNLTVHSYTHDARAICIDDLRTDKYDNDGDGKIDSADTTGVATWQNILALVPGGSNIRDINPFAIPINEKDIDSQAQAVLLWLKLRYGVRYLQADGATYDTTATPLVAGFRDPSANEPGIERGLKHALNIVDYRDADYIPTRIPAGVFGLGDPPRDVYGFEALHVTEVGRCMDVSSFPLTVTEPPWDQIPNGARYVADGGPGPAVSKMAITDNSDPANRKLHVGSYLIRVRLTVPQGQGNPRLRLRLEGNTEDFDTSGTYYLGPFSVKEQAGNAVGEITAMALGGLRGAEYKVEDFQVLLPYIEVMNWSRKPKAIDGLKICVGSGGPGNAMQLAAVRPAFGSSDTTQIPGLMPGGFEDGSNKRGVRYGSIVIVYDEATFERQFAGRDGGGPGDGVWGNQGGEDFPICVMPTVFANGFDGSQNVTLWKDNGLVAGGLIDFGPNAGGLGRAFSADEVAAVRGYIGGDGTFWHTDFGSTGSRRWKPITAPSPGRYKTYSSPSGQCPKWWWPTKFYLEQAPPDPAAEPYGLADCVLVGDRGYFRSPAEVLCLSVPEMHSETFSFEGTWDGAQQPKLSEFLAYLVASRAPARVNINTAWLPVLAAAFCPIEPDSSGYMELGASLPSAIAIAANRGTAYYGDLRDLGARDLFANTYKTPDADNDGCNDGNDNNEKQEWLIRNANVFTLRSSVFSATVAGMVKNAADRTVAKHSLTAVYDRGKELDANWRPTVKLLSATPGD